jgi:HPt (histidine-containing phosphotransfer) domain-containing protein
MRDKLIDPEGWETFKSLADAATLSELLGVYLSDSPELIEQMRAGLGAGDAEQVRRAAHSLKSNSGSFGATRMADAARELEFIAKSGSLGGAADKLAAVEAEYRQLSTLLMELRNDL